MTAELIVAIFTFFNSLRLLAYLLQILCVARDRNGASAISFTTWLLFCASNLSTVAYAAVVVEDARMATVFLANGACCCAVIGLTLIKRMRHHRAKIRDA